MPVFLPDIFSMIRKNRFDDGKENDMEDEVKKLPFKWELGEEQVAFQVETAMGSVQSEIEVNT